LLPPGVRSATTSHLARPRSSVGALLGFSTLQSFLHHGSGFGPSQRHARVSRSPDRAHPRAPSHRGCRPRPGLRRLGSRAQDPSIRSVYRTPRITVRRRPSSSNASRAFECASRQPRPRALPGVSDGASCPCPLSAAPRASLPLTAVSPVRGRRPLDLGDALVEPLTRSCPSRGRLATGPLAELGLVVP